MVDLARIIEWGYETGGDLDEAIRVSIEVDGGDVPTDDERAKLESMFRKEFEE